MRIAIIGSRPDVSTTTLAEEFALVKRRNDARRWALVDYVRGLPTDTVLVSGGAEGADTWAENAASGVGLVVVRCIPAWRFHGKSAGHKRNAVIADIADRCVAFFGAGESRGTAGCVEMFRRLGKPVEEWRFDAAGNYARVS